MDIRYKNNKIRKVCTDINVAQKKYNFKMTVKLYERLQQISQATSIETLIFLRLGRCHPLYGDWLGQYAMDLIHPYRLIFTLYGNTVDIVEIQEIVDYHW